MWFHVMLSSIFLVDSSVLFLVFLYIAIVVVVFDGGVCLFVSV